MEADKVAGKRVLAFTITVAVALGFCVLLERCGNQEFTSESTDPELTRSSAPADHDVGRREFESYCLACHGSDGLGSNSAPRFAGSPWVVGPPSRLIRIVLHGVRGPIDVGGGITYNREMLAFGPILSDARIADLVTFVRRNFGGPTEAITAETVAEVRFATRDRSSYWTAEELLAEPP